MTYPALTKQSANREISEENNKLGFLFGKFVDISVTSNSRATFYNSKDEQIEAATQLHKEFLDNDRLLYSLSLLLPGTTDFSIMTGINMLLSNPLQRGGQYDIIGEKKLIAWMVQNLPPQRMLKLFCGLKEVKVNNSRTRKIILSVLLNSPKLELWSVKYRTKLRISLCHAWGKRTAGIIGSILSRGMDEWAEKEYAIIKKNINFYFEDESIGKKVYECVRFILGNEENLRLPLLKSFAGSKSKIESGRLLPYEVLEGIRSTFHPSVENKYILELTKNKLTDGQKISMQRKSIKSGIEVEFNPDSYDSTRLYLYAYEMGMTEQIRESLSKKASDSAYLFNLSEKKTGILLDCSESMMGSETQKMRPMAAALSLRDVIVKASGESVVFYCGGSIDEESGLVTPSGNTSLAEGFVELLCRDPEVIFIISDGYENSPAGRLDEVIGAALNIGINPKVIHYSPVMASETHGIRELSGKIRTLPFSSPQSSATGLLKEAFASEPESALKILLEYVKPNLVKAKIDNKLLLGV